VREPILGLKTSLLNGGSYLQRVRENLQSVWRHPLAASPGARTWLPLLDETGRQGNFVAQAGSTAAHALAVAAAILAVTNWSVNRNPPAIFHGAPIISYQHERHPLNERPGKLGKAGGGGERNLEPPTAGELAPLSKIELAPPRLPDGRVHPLPQIVTVFNADAPDFPAPVEGLGLPWMTAKSDSAGPGPSGIGSTPGASMGRNGPHGSGESDEWSLYRRAASQVICRVCPDPVYSDEARRNKVQGSVILSVLVGADGRTHEIRVIRGLGKGLDENALQAVGNWQFVPAKDLAQHPVEAWIRVETVFRLF
jgi:TonB family protein